MASQQEPNVQTNRALPVFLDHVKQAVAAMPPVTKFMLWTPYAVFAVDLVITLFFPGRPTLSYWCFLDFDVATRGLEVFRFVSYPFATLYLTDAIIVSLWLIPEMYKLEQRYGSLKLLYVLLTLLTVIPGVVCLVIRQLAIQSSSSLYWVHMTCRGMYGWVVGLICWFYLSEDNEAQDRMIAGTIRIPHQYWPMIVFVMFVFLIPGSSVLLNILCGVIGYLYVKQKLPFLMPSDARLTEIESKAILSPLTKAANFVPTADTSNPYLPIVNDQPSSSFAGQGHRLGP